MESRSSKESTRRVEVFSAGCATCDDTVNLVRELAGDTHGVEVHDMQKAEIVHRAKTLGIRSLPAVVIDGRLAGCCAGRGPDEATIRAELSPTHRTK